MNSHRIVLFIVFCLKSILIADDNPPVNNSATQQNTLSTWAYYGARTSGNPELWQEIYFDKRGGKLPLTGDDVTANRDLSLRGKPVQTESGAYAPGKFLHVIKNGEKWRVDEVKFYGKYCWIKISH